LIQNLDSFGQLEHALTQVDAAEMRIASLKQMHIAIHTKNLHGGTKNGTKETVLYFHVETTQNIDYLKNAPERSIRALKPLFSSI
jgi:UDP-glucose 6-dehydrogenase